MGGKGGRGVYVLDFLRIDQIDLETDPISIDPAAVQAGKIVLRRPLLAAVRVVMRSEDINTALRSPSVQPSMCETVFFSIGSEIRHTTKPLLNFGSGGGVKATTFRSGMAVTHKLLVTRIVSPISGSYAIEQRLRPDK